MEYKPAGVMERCPVCGVLTEMTPAFNTKVGDIVWYCTACEYYMSAPMFEEYRKKRAENAVRSSRKKPIA